MAIDTEAAVAAEEKASTMVDDESGNVPGKMTIVEGEAETMIEKKDDASE